MRKAALLGQPIQGHDEEAMRVIVPVQVKRSGQALRLVICSTDAQEAQGPDPRLIALLTKAQRWFAMLSSGKYPSVLAIANEHGMATSDVTQVIYLAFLAPDIVRRIVDGKHLIGLCFEAAVGDGAAAARLGRSAQGTGILRLTTPDPTQGDAKRPLFTWGARTAGVLCFARHQK